jgi:6-phosphofructokinase 1
VSEGAPRRIGILTGGGDAPGLNAAIRAVVLAAHHLRGASVVGVLDGFEGLLDGRLLELPPERVRSLISRGGTILGTTNRSNPFSHPGPGGPADRSQEVLINARRAGIDVLVVLGGDGTLHIASELAELGQAVVGVPKTIDNDLAATRYTFGFWTAIATATDALDRLRDTAESHHRVMVLEVMGRNAGWIALHAGVAGAADVILLPEIPYRTELVAEVIATHRRRGQAFSIVVVGEGAFPEGGSPEYQEEHPAAGAPRLGGAGERLARELAAATGIEVRATVLGHLQRGGSPVPLDRVLATSFGEHAARLALEGRVGRMVCLSESGEIGDVDLRRAVEEIKRVDPASPLVATARAVGISFGDRAPSPGPPGPLR